MSTPFVILLNDDGTYTLHVEPTAESLMHLAAKAVVFWGQKAIERRGAFHLAMSDGSEHKTLCELLATEPYARQLLWERVHLWWVDEQALPSGHADSDYRMTLETLIGKVPIPAPNVHRVRAELGSEQAAAHYEAELMFTFGLMEIDDETGAILVRGESRPRFDLIVLGLGDDGHTAALYPHTEVLHTQDRLVVSNGAPKPNADRITFTYSLINAADAVLFVVSGAGKAGVLYEVLLGDPRPDVLPAQGIMPMAGKLFWMVDADAAAQVATEPGYPRDSEFIYRRSLAADG